MCQTVCIMAPKISHSLHLNREDGPIERIQKESPQNEPFWHADYFELKTIKAKKDLGIAFCLTLNCLKEFM